MSLPEQFAGKVIALTGAASGIGLATAHLLASRGAILSLADLQAEALQRAEADIKAKYPTTELLAFALDVRNYKQVQSWINSTTQKFGKLDGAANLAGVIPKTIGTRDISEQDAGDWEFVMGVNTTGVMHCLKAQTSIITDNGAIVNASSIAGNTGRPRNSAYAASKHAVIGLTRSVAKETGRRGVRVNAICPGRIETPMLQASFNPEGDRTERQEEIGKEHDQIALGRTGKPEEVAKLIAFLLSDESTYISGACVPIDGGWNC
ncbi:3-oxoacyl-reductase [Xylariaceae sp. FL1272]|nr:3-oxoacyl-reductase [Xylariaceae sp. FL1272]